MTVELPLRIVIVGPLTGVAHQVQRGRVELLPPTRSNRNEITFDFVIRLGEPRTPGAPRFLGEYAQGPTDARFVYVNTGQAAGERDSQWTRRAKIPLKGITVAQVRKVLAGKGLVLEARIAGLARDGGPMCATVPLLGDGWTVIDR